MVAESTEPIHGKTQVRFRKGEKNEKDLFVEVWNSPIGFQSSLKVSEKLSLVYNDTVFGGIQWSHDGNKIVFVGEVPEIAKYDTFFKDPEEPKPEKEEKKDGDEKKKDEHW